LEQTLHFLAGGHTAGEAMLIEQVAAVPADELLAVAARLPARRPAAVGLEVRLVGLVLVEPE
jgi:hypothetical protein